MPYLPSPRKRKTNISSNSGDPVYNSNKNVGINASNNIVNNTDIVTDINVGPKTLFSHLDYVPIDNNLSTQSSISSVASQLSACNLANLKTTKKVSPSNIQAGEAKISYVSNPGQLYENEKRMGEISDDGNSINTANPIDNSVPLSLSFLRRPSRSNSIEVDFEKIMKQNTLMNSKLDQLDHTPPKNENPESSCDSISSDYFGNQHVPCEFNSSAFQYPLVKKKSGELVKSSLKLNSLGYSKSLPSTPTYKQVHFGDNIDVRYFSDKDKPNSVSADNSPHNSDDDFSDTNDKSENDEENDNCSYDYNQIKSAYFELFKASRSFIKQETVRNLENFRKAIRPWNIDSSQFPTVSYKDEIDREVPVFLERCFLNMDKTKLMGQVAVRNISFSKSVTVRYTFDNWLTVINIDASYTPDLPRLLKKSGYDRFVFQMSVPTLLSLYFDYHGVITAPPPHFQFCIRFNSESQEFWDNNTNRNYCIKFLEEKHEENSLVSSIDLSNAYLPTRRKSGDSVVDLKSQFSFVSPINFANSSQSNSTQAPLTLKRSKSFDSTKKFVHSDNVKPFHKDAIKSLSIPTASKSEIDSLNMVDLLPLTQNKGINLNIMKENFSTAKDTELPYKNNDQMLLLKKGQDFLRLENGKEKQDQKIGEQVNEYTNNENVIDGSKETRMKKHEDILKANNEIVATEKLDIRPDPSSESYKSLLEKYCFFQSPSTVSSFLEDDEKENPLLRNYGHSFY